MAAVPYFALADFTLRTAMPAADVAIVETNNPGFVEARIAIEQAKLDARLRRQYLVPFNANGAAVPEVVLGWLTDIVTPSVYRKRGVNPGQDDQVQRLDDLATAALAEVKEAADAQGGMFDLPMLDTGDPTDISKSSPLMTADASPFAWMDRQRCLGRQQDSAGGGWNR